MRSSLSMTSFCPLRFSFLSFLFPPSESSCNFWHRPNTQYLVEQREIKRFDHSFFAFICIAIRVPIVCWLHISYRLFFLFAYISINMDGNTLLHLIKASLESDKNTRHQAEQGLKDVNPKYMHFSHLVTNRFVYTYVSLI